MPYGVSQFYPPAYYGVRTPGEQALHQEIDKLLEERTFADLLDSHMDFDWDTIRKYRRFNVGVRNYTSEDEGFFYLSTYGDFQHARYNGMFMELSPLVKKADRGEISLNDLFINRDAFDANLTRKGRVAQRRKKNIRLGGKTPKRFQSFGGYGKTLIPFSLELQEGLEGVVLQNRPEVSSLSDLPDLLDETAYFQHEQSICYRSEWEHERAQEDQDDMELDRRYSFWDADEDIVIEEEWEAIEEDEFASAEELFEYLNEGREVSAQEQINNLLFNSDTEDDEISQEMLAASVIGRG